ncbi:MAG: hypothetical protein ACLFRY_12145 [Spirochaetia bacterium]
MKYSILYTDTRDPLYGYTRGEVFEAVYVYGSFAREMVRVV